MGLAVQVEVKRKEQPPVGDADRVRSSDGLSLWIDTRDSRASHRASRYCHHFHFLPTGGGADKEDPFIAQLKINRAQQDAPQANLAGIPFRRIVSREGTGSTRSCQPRRYMALTRWNTRDWASITWFAIRNWAISS